MAAERCNVSCAARPGLRVVGGCGFYGKIRGWDEMAEMAGSKAGWWDMRGLDLTGLSPWLFIIHRSHTVASMESSAAQSVQCGLAGWHEICNL
ncbi:unnamed protein product [[Candida] boidinii]|uniref:Unnamed protein product n=1 Tax=Candida boidinii TaxID=5477 RepID=A0ACB5TSC7_CANBO|nr:unnamed protein product [[Candida] boidinii]